MVGRAATMVVAAFVQVPDGQASATVWIVVSLSTHEWVCRLATWKTNRPWAVEFNWGWPEAEETARVA